MTTFVAASPDVQVNSLLMLGILDALSEEETVPLLEKHNIPELAPGQWHDLQPFLDLLRDLAEGDLEGMYNFVSIGMSIVEHIDFPPDITGLEDALCFLDTVYHDSLQNVPESEGWRVECINENHYIACCESPFPGDMEYGIVYATTRHFCPRGRSFAIRREVLESDRWELHVELD